MSNMANSFHKYLNFFFENICGFHSIGVYVRTKSCMKYWYQILYLALDKSGWSTSRSGRLTCDKQPRYPLYRRIGREWGRHRVCLVGGGEDQVFCLLQWLAFHTVQPVVSRYTDYIVPAPQMLMWRHRIVYQFVQVLRLDADSGGHAF
jgi:hypothetical protein